MHDMHLSWHYWLIAPLLVGASFSGDYNRLARGDIDTAAELMVLFGYIQMYQQDNF